jgi:hypothetical protein
MDSSCSVEAGQPATSGRFMLFVFEQGLPLFHAYKYMPGTDCLDNSATV